MTKNRRTDPDITEHYHRVEEYLIPIISRDNNPIVVAILSGQEENYIPLIKTFDTFTGRFPTGNQLFIAIAMLLRPQACKFFFDTYGTSSNFIFIGIVEITMTHPLLLTILDNIIKVQTILPQILNVVNNSETSDGETSLIYSTDGISLMVWTDYLNNLVDETISIGLDPHTKRRCITMRPAEPYHASIIDHDSVIVALEHTAN